MLGDDSQDRVFARQPFHDAAWGAGEVHRRHAHRKGCHVYALERRLIDHRQAGALRHGVPQKQARSRDGLQESHRFVRGLGRMHDVTGAFEKTAHGFEDVGLIFYDKDRTHEGQGRNVAWNGESGASRTGRAVRAFRRAMPSITGHACDWHADLRRSGLRRIVRTVTNTQGLDPARGRTFAHNGRIGSSLVVGSMLSLVGARLTEPSRRDGRYASSRGAPIVE